MRKSFVLIVLAMSIGRGHAEDDPDAASSPAKTAATVSVAVVPSTMPGGAAATPLVLPTTPVLPFTPAALAARPRGKPPETPEEVAARDRADSAKTAAANDAAAGGRAGRGAAPLAYVVEDKWGLAGYNNDEVFYTILVTNHDARALRCTVVLQGTFIDNGEKVSISDRQTASVLPGQQAALGNWQNMDRESGAHYAVSCHPA